MRNARRIWWLLAFLLQGSLALYAGMETNRFVFADTAILEPASLSSRSLQQLRPFWKPETEEVEQAMANLEAFLKKSKTTSNVAQNKAIDGALSGFSETLCQFSGITYEGQRGILLNCFPVKFFGRGIRDNNWKEHFIRVYDGGPRYWSVVYLSQKKTLSRLKFDYGY